MPPLIAPSKSTYKPSAGAQLDRGHPLAHELLGLWLMNEGAGAVLTNLAGPQNGMLNTAVHTWRPIPHPGACAGIANGVSDGAFSAGPTGSPLSLTALPATFAIGYYPESMTDNHRFFGSDGQNANQAGLNADLQNTGAWRCYFGDNTGTSTSTARRVKATATGLAVAGQYYVAVFSFRGATDMSIILNGVDVGGTYTGSGGALANGASPQFRLGDAAAVGTSLWNGRMAWAAFWARSLSPAEAFQLYVEPYSMLLPPAPRMLYFAVNGGTPPAITPRRQLLLGVG